VSNFPSLIRLPGPVAFVDAVRATLSRGPLIRCEVLRGDGTAALRVPAAPEDTIALVIATQPDITVVVKRFTWGDPGDTAEGIQSFVVQGDSVTTSGWFHANDHDWPVEPLIAAMPTKGEDGKAPKHLDWMDGVERDFEPAQVVGRTVAALDVRRAGVLLTCGDGTTLELRATWECGPDGYSPSTRVCLASRAPV
jgi:hypothetical protein